VEDQIGKNEHPTEMAGGRDVWRVGPSGRLPEEEEEEFVFKVINVLYNIR